MRSFGTLIDGTTRLNIIILLSLVILYLFPYTRVILRKIEEFIDKKINHTVVVIFITIWLFSIGFSILNIAENFINWFFSSFRL